MPGCFRKVKVARGARAERGGIWWRKASGASQIWAVTFTYPSDSYGHKGRDRAIRSWQIDSCRRDTMRRESEKGIRGVGPSLDRGSLRGNEADQNCDLPGTADLHQYQSVVIHYERFHPSFGVAQVREVLKQKYRKRPSKEGFTALPMKPPARLEAELIARIVAGEKELFHELVRPYERMVYLTVFSIVKNEADAEDGAQEAVINAYRHLSSFRAEAKFSTWLTTIAINEGRKRLRKTKGVAEDSLDAQEQEKEGDYTPQPLTDWREIPLEALERKELREALRKAVAELPTIYRQVFTLRDLEELNIEETSQALGIHAGVVKVRLHRARIMLQKKLVPFLRTTAPARRGFFRRAHEA